MYVPTNIASPSATYAPVTPTAIPAITQAQALGATRQTQLAVTGPGATLISNQTTSRQLQSAVAERAPSITQPLQVQDDASLSSPIEVAASAPRATSASLQLTMPRPAYIAAQFLAQDLSPQEVAMFFTPNEVQPQATRVDTNVQNQLRDMRTALGMDRNVAQQIVIKQNTPVSSNVEAPRTSSFAPALSLRNQAPLESAERLAKPIRRGSIAQTYGEAAYDSANLRNAQLASTIEVDTTS